MCSRLHGIHVSHEMHELLGMHEMHEVFVQARSIKLVTASLNFLACVRVISLLGSLIGSCKVSLFACSTSRALVAFVLASSSWCWARYIKMRIERIGGSSRNCSRDCRWILPSTSSFKLNFDRACNPSSGLASSAAVVMDEHGKWLWGFERNIGRCSIKQVEIWAIYDGLQFAWDVRWKEVIVETNCTIVVKDILPWWSQKTYKQRLLEFKTSTSTISVWLSNISLEK